MIKDVEMFSLGRAILTLAFEPFKILESINFGCKPNNWNVKYSCISRRGQS